MYGREKLFTMKVNIFTLAFEGEDKHLEAGFLEYHFQNTINVFRIAFVIGAFLYAIFGILDAILMPEVKYQTWIVRYVVVIPALLLTVWFSYSIHFRKFWAISFIILLIIAGAGIIYMIAIAPYPVNYSYYAGLILVLIFGYTFVRARFIWATIAGFTVIILYELVAVFVIRTPLPILISNNFFFLSANFMGMFACYTIEYFARRNYCLMMQVENEKEKVSRVNRELEEKVRELGEALENIETLRGLIPICSRCKKIRDDKGYWNQLEEYISQHSSAVFSHSICPQCAAELYGKDNPDDPEKEP